MAPKSTKKLSAPAETEPSRKSPRLSANQTSLPTEPRINDANKPSNNPQREIHVVVDGDEIADIINKMARRCIRGVAREPDYENVIVTFQERALDALEDLYTRVDARAEWAKTRNRGSFADSYRENDEDDDLDELIDDEEAGEARRRKAAARGPIVVDVHAYPSDQNVFGKEDDCYCFCRKKENGRMYCCANVDCATGWFHEECIVKLMK